ncbi:gas vesicle protein [Priestia megaterium]|uniref:hypothetical protein n=1 Tax=Priestia megaterium TaxID=1404 RepID=UPI0033925EF9
MDIVKLTEMLKVQGLSDEMIEEVLKNASEQEDKHLNVKQASAYLVDKLDKSWNPAKVRRFIASGQLQTVNQIDRKGEEGSSLKEGYQIDKEVLEAFVEDQSKTKEDWKEEALTLREEVQALKSKIAALQEGSSSQSSDAGVSDLPIEGQIQWDENGEFEEAKNETPENLENPLTPTDEELVATCKKAVFVDNEEHFLRVEDALESLNSIIAERPEFDNMKATFVDRVFGGYEAVKIAPKDGKKFKAPHKKRGQYEYETKEAAIIGTLEALKKQG